MDGNNSSEDPYTDIVQEMDFALEMARFTGPGNERAYAVGKYEGLQFALAKIRTAVMGRGDARSAEPERSGEFRRDLYGRFTSQAR